MEAGEVVGGRFVIEQEVGSGGMADVYRARDLDAGGHVAVKALRAETPDDEIRFTREAEVLARLEHPAIVRYVAHGTNPSADGRGPGQLYLVMEWLEGDDLGVRMERAGLSMVECVTLGRRVAEALGMAHAWGIVHRDVKPSNIILEGGRIERAKLIDFGIARKRTQVDLTRPGIAIGTPRFMAPEQARGERVTPSADIFALGCVLFAALTGAPPFDADDVVTILLKIVLEEAPRLLDLREDVPPGLDELVANMLSKAPEQRPEATWVAAELGLLASAATSRVAPTSIRRPELTTTEQLLRFIVLARPLDTTGTWDTATISLNAVDSQRATLHAAIARFGATLDYLADGTLLVHGPTSVWPTTRLRRPHGAR